MTAPDPVTDDPLALERQVCFALAVASRTVIAAYRPLLEPLGLTHPQYLVMLALWEQTPLRVSALSERLHLEPATLSPLLKRLESAGLVTRDRDRDDERALAVGLTAEGRRLRARAERTPQAVVELLGMDLESLEAMREVLTDVAERARRSSSRS